MVLIGGKGGGRVGSEESLEGVGRVHGDDEVTVARGDLAWVVPFQISRRAVPEVDCFPVCVVAWVKRPAGFFKFVGKDEFVLFAIEACSCFCSVRGCGVY